MTAADLIVGVHDLLRRPGTRLIVDAKMDLGDLSTSTATVPEGTQIQVEATLDSISDGVVLNVELDVPWEGDCRRCLEPAKGTSRVEVHEVYREQPVEDMLPMVDESIDVGEAIRDAAMLSLPIAPLCRDDCSGPAPADFPVQLADQEPVDVVDPRWAALDQLHFDSGGDDG